MLTLITGGSASGKSAFAERLLSACNASTRNVTPVFGVIGRLVQNGDFLPSNAPPGFPP